MVILIGQLLGKEALVELMQLNEIAENKLLPEDLNTS